MRAFHVVQKPNVLHYQFSGGRAYILFHDSKPFFSGHPFQCCDFVGLREMRVSLDHLQRAMSQRVGDLQQTRALLGEVGSRGVSQIMKAKIGDSRRLERVIPMRIKMVVRTQEATWLREYIL